MRDLTRERRGLTPNGAASIVDAALPVMPPEPEAPPVSTESPEREGAQAPPLTDARPAMLERFAEEVAPYVAEYLLSAREKKLARMSRTMIETAKLLEPLTRIAVARVLTLAAWASLVGVTAYAATLAREWNLVAILLGFQAVCALVIVRGQPKAPPEPGR